MFETRTKTKLTFKGEYPFKADSGRRVQFPIKWRPSGELTLSIHIWKIDGNPSCLLVLQPETVQDVQTQFEAMSFSDAKTDSLRRLLWGDADDIKLDETGRITLPERLASKVKLGKDLMLVGMGDRFQIWDAQVFKDIQTADEVQRPEAMKLLG